MDDNEFISVQLEVESYCVESNSTTHFLPYQIFVLLVLAGVKDCISYGEMLTFLSML